MKKCPHNLKEKISQLYDEAKVNKNFAEEGYLSNEDTEYRNWMWFYEGMMSAYEKLLKSNEEEEL